MPQQRYCCVLLCCCIALRYRKFLFLSAEQVCGKKQINGTVSKPAYQTTCVTSQCCSTRLALQIVTSLTATCCSPEKNWLSFMDEVAEGSPRALSVTSHLRASLICSKMDARWSLTLSFLRYVFCTTANRLTAAIRGTVEKTYFPLSPAVFRGPPADRRATGLAQQRQRTHYLGRLY